MKNIKGRRIALVGGAGFIGHNLALELKRLGAEVSIVDGLSVNNLLYFHQTNIDIPHRDMYLEIINERLDLLRSHHIPLYVEDARNYHKLSQVFGEIKPQVVVLLAAVAHANRSNKDPYTTFDHSTRTLENALDASREGVEHFIYFSSSMVYGDFNGMAVTEETPCNPKGIYGALKLGAEKLVIAYNQVFNLPYTIVRPSALYGERCVSRRVGQIFIENALKGEPVNINGDGSDSLDFTYIGDLVQGLVKVIEHEESKGQIFNMTYGQARPIKQMADMIQKHFPKVKVNYLPKDKLMPERGTLCVDKAKKLIGYDPQFPLDKGFVNYIKWYKGSFERT
ncbi:MAG: NAD-dependent epimerase/dehydratase family protein [Candidatus Omnitrophota bacterium]|nr:NAD-dependent epimerase/dehydratase family protein [Candidatus Omnitrophota bacterium]